MSDSKKRKRHSPERIIAKLREADGMKSGEAKRLKELEQENARLKKLLAEAELDKAMLKQIAEGKW